MGFDSCTPVELITDGTPITYGVVQPGPEDKNGVLFIRGGDISGGRIKISSLRTISRELSNQYKRTLLKGGELVISLVGNPGEVAIVPDALKGANIARQVGLVRVDQNRFYPKFVQYYLMSPAGKAQLFSYSLGSVQSVINLKELRRVEIPNFPLKNQEKIVKCLGEIDGKIDLNRCINQTLEAMAQAIFKSWFVDFDPVKAKIAAIEQGQDPLRAAMRAISGKTDVELDQMPREHHDQLASTAALFPDAMEESELGDIPKGWAFQSADSLTEVGIGKTPPRKEPQWFTEGGGDWRWVSIKDMGASGVFQQRSSEFLTSEAVSRFNVRVVPDRTVLLSFKLTIGRLAITDGPMVTNEAIAHFNLPNDSAISSEYLYLYLKSFDYSTLGSTSSIADAVNSKTIREMPIIVASLSLVDRFTRSVTPLFMEMKNRQNEIASLCATRDALLPRLLSGEVEVSP